MFVSSSRAKRSLEALGFKMLFANIDLLLEQLTSSSYRRHPEDTYSSILPSRLT